MTESLAKTSGIKKNHKRKKLLSLMKKINNDPLVSIIIPVYNGSKYMREAIDSALNQTYKHKEVIVVDDGSSDDSWQIIKSYGQRIRAFKKKNGGISTALNLGIKQAKGKYISWLSHDDVYAPNKLNKQVEAINNLPIKESEDTILFSNYKVIDKNSKVIEAPAIELAHDIKKFSNHLYPVVKGLVFGCTLLIPKKCFEEQGLFSESLKTSQDTDMWLRLFPKYQISFQKEYLLFSRKHPGQGTHSVRAKKESNTLWCNIINKISEEDKKFFDGSVECFYFSIQKQMERVGYKIAEDYAKKKLYSLNISFISILKYRITYSFKPFLSKIRRVFNKLI